MCEGVVDVVCMGVVCEGVECEGMECMGGCGWVWCI